MSKNNKNNRTSPKLSNSPAETSLGNDKIPRVTSTHYDRVWITDGAWLSGLAGVVAIFGLAYIYSQHNTLQVGVNLWGLELARNRAEAIVLALGVVTLCMVSVELVRIARFFGASYIRRDPLVREGQLGRFLLLCTKHFLLYLVLFAVLRQAYFLLSEYGYAKSAPYYQPWFTTLDFLWHAFLWAGLPYIILTRAFKHDPEADKKDYAVLTAKVLSYLLVRPLSRFGVEQPSFGIDDKRAALGLLVKFFFAPVITVFFFDNFPNLIHNVRYILADDGLFFKVSNGTYSHAIFNKDLHSISTSFIFCVDVGLAWVGYMVSSRWVDSQTVSAEPSLLGWVVCLLSYPPFRAVTGWFFIGASESAYKQFSDPVVVSVLGSLVIFSFFMYMLPTVWFGVRFSNLTHRGIVRKGPFAIVRHPAYASKNFAWWCVGFPAAIYLGFRYDNFTYTLVSILGLASSTFIYYLRAITEERHLSMDPDYVEYCRHVKYRFIPGVI